MDFLLDATSLPLIFAILMGVAVFMYIILDGYDLGIGLLFFRALEKERDHMMAAIGPFWDANETWLVLGVGILLVAFPVAHGVILTALYLPTAMMICGLILRGVAFDFRSKVKTEHKSLWDKTFFVGSSITTLAQGYMLGLYIIGFSQTIGAILFALLCSICLVAGYILLGASWLILKTQDSLQVKAIRWAQKALWGGAIGLIAVSVVTPLVSPRIFFKWFSFPTFFFLAPIPITTGILFLGLYSLLKKLPKPKDRHYWLPFVLSISIVACGFIGLAYSFFPYIVPDRLTIWEAASAPESLRLILWGALLVLPCILAYTIFAYRVFWGKVEGLHYY